MQLNREKIQRMFTGSQANGGGGGGGDTEGLASQLWVEQNYLSKEFFLRLFNIHGEDENDDPVDVQPNDLETTITDIEAMFGFWTEQYLSALGQNSEQGGGGITLNAALASINNSPLGNPTGTSTVLMFNGTTWVYASMGSTDMNTVWTALADGTDTHQINVSHLTTALSGYATTSQLSDYATVTDLEQLASYFNTLSGYFTNGAANEAVKLETARTIWGQQFDGTANVSGDITQATCLEFSGIAGTATNGGFIDFHYAGGGADYTSRIIEDVSGVLKINNTIWAQLSGNVSIGTSTISHTYKLDIAGYTKTTRLYLAEGVYLEYDSTNSGVHLVGAGFYSDSYVSALGVNSGGGGGGSDYIPLTGSSSITGTLAPSVATADLGSSTNKWRNIYGTSLSISNTLTTYALTINSSATVVGSITSTNGNLVASTGYVSSAGGYKVTGSDNTSVLLAGGGTKPLSEIGSAYTLPAATAAALGGLKVNQSYGQAATVQASGNTGTRNYGLQIDSNGMGFVYVPWENTDNDTKNTAGATNLTATKMYLVGATEQSANPQTYTNSNCYINTDNCLYSNGSKVLTVAETGFLPLTGGTLTGDVNLSNSNAGDTPALKFVRGTVSDNYTDWRIYCSVGDLYFDANINQTWVRKIVFATDTSSGNAWIIANLEGNATTATKLETSRTIWGQSFDGSASINNVPISGIRESLTFSRDSFNYICVPATSGRIALNIGEAGTDRTKLLVDNNGNVGIGTTSPSYKLHVNGNIKATHVYDGNGNEYLTSTLSATASTLGMVKLATNAYGQEVTLASSGQSSTRNYGLQMDSTGKAFVYVPWEDNNTDTKNTAGATNLTATKMYLVGATEQSTNPQTYSNSNCYINTDNCLYSNGSKVATTSDLSGYLPLTGGELTGNLKISGSGRLSMWESFSFTRESWNYICVPAYGGVLSFNIGAAGTANTKMAIINNGNVGIGTTSPSYKLHVDGAGYFTGKVYSEGNEVLTSGSVVTTNTAQNITGAKTFTATLTSSAGGSFTGGLRFYSLCVECASDGTPSSSRYGEINRYNGTLHLQYDSGTGAVTMCRQGFTFTNPGTTSQLSTSNKNLQIAVGTGDAYVDKAWVINSDMRKKDIAQYINIDINSIADAPVFNFTWKNDITRQLTLGTSAQYWKTVFPNAVRQTPDSYLGMDYSSIALASAVLTARKVVDHEARIRLLEVENAALRNEINQLKKVA